MTQFRKSNFHFPKISEELQSQRYCIIEDFLDPESLEFLRASFRDPDFQNRFSKAGVGKGVNNQARAEIRRDRTLWLDPEDQSLTAGYLWKILNGLKQFLNEELFLGLWDFEGHFAIYEPGAFYKRHLDTFENDGSRTVSLVLYLSESWFPGDGGELSIYLPDKEVIVAPKPGTFVCFLSREFEHQVQESHKIRWSFTGWFRKRGDIL